MILIALVGLISGIMAGLMGVGGGALVVPCLVAIGIPPVNATATSTLAMLFSSVSGTITNFRQAGFNTKRIASIALPSMITAQFGVMVAQRLSPYVLLFCLGILLLIIIYLFHLRRNLSAEGMANISTNSPSYFTNYVMTGVVSGFLAGVFGIGGGIVLVPMLVILFKDPIKDAIRSSLGVITLTALSAFIGYASNGLVYYQEGICLGFGGVIGAQLGTVLLNKVSEKHTALIFQIIVFFLAGYMFWKAYLNLPG